MTAPPLDAHRTDIDALITYSLEALAGAWIDGDPNDIRDALAAALPDLVATYGSAAATLGADWYDEMREAAEVSGRFRAIVAELPDQGRLDSLVGWGTQPLFEPADFVSLDEFVPDLDTAKAKVSGGFQRIVADADRDSVMESLTRDPKAAGWRRQTTGASCAFCIMIAGRGAVFSAQTARFSSHDRCDCVCVPAFGDAVKVEKYTPSTRFGTQAKRDANNAGIRDYLNSGKTARPGNRRTPEPTRSRDVDAGRTVAQLRTTLASLERSQARFASPGTAARIAGLRRQIEARS